MNEPRGCPTPGACSCPPPDASACQHRETQYFGDGVYRCAECGDMVETPKLEYTPGTSAGREEPYLDTELLCPKCREPNTIGELRERHECKKCGHPSGNRRRAGAGREEPAAMPEKAVVADDWWVSDSVLAVLREFGVTVYEGTDHRGPWRTGWTSTERALASALAAERAAGEDARILARGLDCIRRGLVTTRDGMDWRIACTGGRLSYQTALAAIRGITLDGRLDDDLLDKYLARALAARTADPEHPTATEGA